MRVGQTLNFLPLRANHLLVKNGKLITLRPRLLGPSFGNPVRAWSRRVAGNRTRPRASWPVSVLCGFEIRGSVLRRSVPALRMLAEAARGGRRGRRRPRAGRTLAPHGAGRWPGARRVRPSAPGGARRCVSGPASGSFPAAAPQCPPSRRSPKEFGSVGEICFFQKN